MISRSEGYRLSEGKESASLAIAQGFLLEVFGENSSVVVEESLNYLSGDLVLGGGAFIECKSQPINPVRYSKNFVEICEITNSPRHSGGSRDLALILGLQIDHLASIRVFDAPQGKWGHFGNPEYLSVSVRSIFGADFTMYLNARAGEEFLYLYPRSEITTLLLEHVRLGMVRGAGKSNVDTFGIKVPLPNWIWQRQSNQWAFVGEGAAPTSLRVNP